MNNHSDRLDPSNQTGVFGEREMRKIYATESTVPCTKNGGGKVLVWNWQPLPKVAL